MNEQVNEQAVSEQAKGTEQHTENGQERPAHLSPFATLDEAKKVTPPSKNFRVFAVKSPDGSKVWAWGQSADNAIVIAAKAVGWKSEAAEPKGTPLTKERIGSALAAMSDEDRAILIAQYVPAPVNSPAPGKGKGKK